MSAVRRRRPDSTNREPSWSMQKHTSAESPCHLGALANRSAKSHWMRRPDTLFTRRRQNLWTRPATSERTGPELRRRHLPQATRARSMGAAQHTPPRTQFRADGGPGDLARVGLRIARLQHGRLGPARLMLQNRGLARSGVAAKPRLEETQGPHIYYRLAVPERMTQPWWHSCALT